MARFGGGCCLGGVACPLGKEVGEGFGDQSADSGGADCGRGGGDGAKWLCAAGLVLRVCVDQP